MYLDRQVQRELARIGGNGYPRSRRFFVLSQLALRSARAVVSLGRRLDDWLCPGYREIEVKEPLFIYAAPRSGTTLLHRLLSLDEERFAYSKLYHTVLQSRCLIRAVEKLGAWDHALGGPCARLLTRVDRRLFGGWEGIHPMGINEPEEDEALFIFSLLSPGMVVFYPWIARLERALWLDRCEPEVRRAVMQDYLGSARRLLSLGPPGRSLLTKSVLMSGRIESVLETFPDARFVYLVRHPYETIPSLLSLCWAVWEILWPRLATDSEASRRLAQVGIEYYRLGLQARRKLPESRFLVLPYTELVADPMAAVGRVYGHFGLQQSPAFSAKLTERVGALRSYRRRHEYTLERFGLSRAELYSELREVFDEFGFDPRAAEGPG